MSLEAKIEALTAAVEALTEKLEAQATPAKAPAKPSTKAKTEPAKEEPPEQVEGPSVESLQELAMKKVRADRTKKTAIKELIASFDGAKVIGDVPTAKLPELAEKLEAI